MRGKEEVALSGVPGTRTKLGPLLDIRSLHVNGVNVINTKLQVELAIRKVNKRIKDR